MIGMGGTHNFKMTALVRGVLWTFEGATKMKGRVVDELDVDVRRLVVLAILRGTVGGSDFGSDARKELAIGLTSNFFVYSAKSCISHDRTGNGVENWM
jgi:hypothetical protein